MDLRQIRYFVAVYEEGSFSKAAQRERCTQPGLSVHIQRLEAMLSQRLFERNARGVTATAAGRHFYGCCTDVLRAVKTANQRMLDLAGSIAGTVNIGLPSSFCKSALASILPDFVHEHPFVDVRIAEAYSGTLTEWVVSGQLDIAIVTEPPRHLGLESTRFFRDRLVLVMAPGAAGGKPRFRPRTADELERLKLIVPSERHSLRRIVGSSVQLHPEAGGKVLELDGLIGTLDLVRNSDWTAILPVVAVIDEVREGRLSAAPISDPELRLDFLLVQTKDQPLSVASRHFLQSLKKALSEISCLWPHALDQRRRLVKRH
jgi:LysR family transcriptional regulator, nitrogen assimilation regulatory protein